MNACNLGQRVERLDSYQFTIAIMACAAIKLVCLNKSSTNVLLALRKYFQDRTIRGLW